MPNSFIPLSVPHFAGNEKEYVEKAVVSEWVSTGGSLVGGFEEKLAAAVGMPAAVACASGTAGLHLAMLVAGVQPGDEVIVPSLTFIAAVNPVHYAGGVPVFIGCDDTLCLDADAAERFCEECCEVRGGALVNKTSGRRVRALEVVHVFGNLAGMPRLCALAQKYGLALIEDATEAVGSYYTEGPFAHRHAGTCGDVGVYSFNGNKIITTGSGGMLVSNHAGWLARAKHLSTQAKTDEVRYLHDEVGYNYRMTNLQAALGLAQLEQLEGFIARKKQLYDAYVRRLHGQMGLSVLPFCPGTRPNHWFVSLLLGPGYPLSRDALIDRLRGENIQTRPIWGLVHQQKPYAGCEAYATAKAEDYAARVVNLPCSVGLANEDQARVCETILGVAHAH